MFLTFSLFAYIEDCFSSWVIYLNMWQQLKLWNCHQFTWIFRLYLQTFFFYCILHCWRKYGNTCFLFLKLLRKADDKLQSVAEQHVAYFCAVLWALKKSPMCFLPVIPTALHPPGEGRYFFFLTWKISTKTICWTNAAVGLSKMTCLVKTDHLKRDRRKRRPCLIFHQMKAVLWCWHWSHQGCSINWHSALLSWRYLNRGNLGVLES